jgi:hypothetical protein
MPTFAKIAQLRSDKAGEQPFYLSRPKSPTGGCYAEGQTADKGRQEPLYGFD